MTFATKLAVLATAVLATVSAQTGSYTNIVSCTTNPTEFAVTSAAVSPSPMCVGKPVCLTVTGTLTDTIVQGGTYRSIGRFLGRLVYTDEQDLCALLAASGTPCPIAPGPYTLNFCPTLKPNVPPSISFDWRYEAVNGDGGTLFCQGNPVAQGVPSGLVAAVCP